MKQAIILVATFVLVLAAPGFAAGSSADSPAAPAPETIVHDANSAFAYLKSLAGQWQSTSTNAEQHGTNYPVVKIRVMAAGSAVVQSVYEGQPNEMESVFHMDGDQLLLTHYCALQNAPVLKFVPSENPGELKFAFHGGTNFDPAVDAHFHEGSFLIKDQDTFESTFVVFANGKAQPEGRGILHRKPSESP